MGSGPNFSNLGVTDPTTGKPVYLSSGDIANVMGATGGVAPTQFQAATEGFIKGVGQGIDIQTNYAQMQQEQVAARIAQQTEQAQITARNNQLQQQAIQSKIQATSQTNDNTVLAAIQSPNPADLIKVISDPALISSAIKYNKEITAVAAGYKVNNVFTPTDLEALKKYEMTNTIFKNGDVNQAYQETGKALSGITEIVQLQRDSGLPMDQLLAQMTVQQDPKGFDPVTGEPSFYSGGTFVVAPGGQKVAISDKNADAFAKAAEAFFPNRNAMQNPAPLRSPMEFPAVPPPPTQAAPATQTAPGTTAALPAAAPATPPVAPTEAPVTAQASKTVPTAQTTVNPNNISATGASLDTPVEQLRLLNTKTTYDKNPISGDLAREAHKIFLADKQISMTEAFNAASKMTAKLTPLSDTVVAQVAKGDIAAEEGLRIAREIRAAVEDSDALGYPLGPMPADYIGRAISNVPVIGGGQAGEVTEESPDGTKTTRYVGSVGDLISRISRLQGETSLNLIAANDITAKYIDVKEERKKLEAMLPGFATSDREMLAIADKTEAVAKRTQDINYLTRFYDTINVPKVQADGLIAQYLSTNPILVWDKTTNTFILPKDRVDVVKWAYESQGVDYNKEVSRTFSSPTSIPKAPPTEVPLAAASGTPGPFDVPKKENASAFPQAPNTPEMRGGSYDQTQALMPSLKAIAHTAAAGGNVKQFQQTGSVPTKLDKATPDLIARMIGRESAGNPNAVSPIKRDSTGKIVAGGVEGLMQVTKPTFNEMAKKGTEIPLTNRRDPLQSVVAGTEYVNELLKKYDGNVDLALAAYNAGPKTVDGILEARGLSKARTTIDMIDKDLPDIQPTAQYVRDITSRGRVGAEPQKKEGKGFFDNFSLVATAEAEEFSPVKEASPERKAEVAQKIASGEITDLGTIGPSNAAPKTAPDYPEGAPLSQSVEGPGSTTAPAAKVPEMDVAPRGDVPPTSEIIEALKEDYIKGIKPYKPAMNRAVEWVRESPIGKFLQEVKESPFGGALDTYANALTSGFYDEGIWALSRSLGLDGNAMQKESRESVKNFRKGYPKISNLIDLVGSAHGWYAGGVLLKALRPAQAAPKAISTVKKIRKGANMMGVGLGARLAGENEGGLVDKLQAGATGYVGGYTLGAGVAGMGALPVVGQAGAAALGLGALGTSLATGGDPNATAAGGVIGTAIGISAALIGRYSPLVGSILSNVVTRLNNIESLRAAANMFRKILTSETAEEASLKLSDKEVMLSQILKGVPEADKRAWVAELRRLAQEYPELMPGLLDVMENVPKSKTFAKIIMGIGDDPATAYRMNTAIQRRSAARPGQLEQALGPLEGIERAAIQFQEGLRQANRGARRTAIADTSPLYNEAKRATPEFNSRLIDEILTAPDMQEAVAFGRADWLGPRTTQTPEQLIADRSRRIVERLTADPNAYIDDLMLPPERLTDNSYEVLTRAFRHLRGELTDKATGDHKTELIRLTERLQNEMGRLNPRWAEANAAYDASLATTDILRPKLGSDSSVMKTIENMADGDIEKVLPKLMNMSPGELEKVVMALEDTPYFQDNPNTMAEVATAYLIRKIKNVPEGKAFTKDMVTKGEQQNLQTLLGDDAFTRLMDMVEAHRKTAGTEKALAPGSHTASMTEGIKEFNAYTGKVDVAGTAADIVGTSWYQTAARFVRTTLRSFLPKADPAKIEAAADMLLLKAEDGVAAMENVLRKEGLEKEAIARMAPYLKEWAQLAKAGAGGAGVTGVVGGMDEHDRTKLGKPRPRKKK